MRITESQLRKIIREEFSRLPRERGQREGAGNRSMRNLKTTLVQEGPAGGGQDPRHWKPNPMLQSRYDFGVDMESPAASYFETDFGTYAHEPADDDVIYFSPRGNPRKVIELGSGNFNTAKTLAIRHHESLSNPPPAVEPGVSPQGAYRDELMKALAKDRSFTVSRARGRIGGHREYPNGRLVQFDVRESPGGVGVATLVMELMGSEDEDVGVLEEDDPELTLSSDPGVAARDILELVQDFVQKHHSLLEARA